MSTISGLSCNISVLVQLYDAVKENN